MHGGLEIQAMAVADFSRRQAGWQVMEMATGNI